MWSHMKAIVLNCTLKKSPEASNTQMLADEVISPQERGVEFETVHLVDLNNAPGSGVLLHVKLTKEAGVTRDEVISAVSVGLPAAGQGITQVLPTAIAAYDAG